MARYVIRTKSGSFYLLESQDTTFSGRKWHLYAGDTKYEVALLIEEEFITDNEITNVSLLGKNKELVEKGIEDKKLIKKIMNIGEFIGKIPMCHDGNKELKTSKILNYQTLK